MKTRIFTLASIVAMIVAIVFPVANSVMAMATDKAPPVAMNRNFVSIESGTLTAVQNVRNAAVQSTTYSLQCIGVTITSGNNAINADAVNIAIQVINQYQPVLGTVNLANIVFPTEQCVNYYSPPAQYINENSFGPNNVVTNNTADSNGANGMSKTSNLNSEIEQTSGAQVVTTLNILKL